MNITFYTLGCKVNQYETQSIRECFLKKGYSCDKNKKADIIIINSCTVTAESDRKTRQLLRKCRKNNNESVIVLTGCMVEAFPEKSELYPEADIITGNTNIEKIVFLTEKFINEKEKIIDVEPHKPFEKYNTPSIDSFSERTRAYMKIEDGCERYCSYCIIPTARGVVRSRKTEDIKNEALRLAENGYKEIVLVGINLSAYGKGEDYNLCDAVDAVCSVEGIKRVRLGSLEPDHITDEMLKRFKKQKKFCPQFHLSLQSGCDETLKRMNRHYDGAFYLDLVERIRKIFDDSSVTTDIMVGFAGETQEEFNKSLEFVEKIGFARAHIFVYSRREGTVAAALKNQVVNCEKEKRARLMSEISRKSEKDFLKNQCGKIFPVLFEKCENSVAYGYTPNYTRVAVKTDKKLNSQIHNVKIISSFDDYCEGIIV